MKREVADETSREGNYPRQQNETNHYKDYTNIGKYELVCLRK